MTTKDISVGMKEMIHKRKPYSPVLNFQLVLKGS